MVRSAERAPFTEVMGIVNVTPDSFSDGGRYFEPAEAIRRARNLFAEGAALVDLGGESTRPGATPLDWETEWTRLEPVLAELRKDGLRLSVDTYHPETAARAIACGASVINCVRSAAVPALLPLLDGNAVELVVPASAFDESSADARLAELNRAGRLYLDPLIGFGTTREEDLALLKLVPELAKRGRVLVGASRKRIVRKLTGEKVLGKNLGGNLGLAVWCALHEARIVRVHDVRETVQALHVIQALEA